MMHLIFTCLAVIAATADASCLLVGVGGREAFEFHIEQSIEGVEGRIAEVKDASPQAAARPFSQLDGTLTLTRVCAAGGVEGGFVMEGKVSDVRVRCDEGLTPDVELSECAVSWGPLGDPLSGAAAQLAAPFWFTRNASGHVSVEAAVLAEPNKRRGLAGAGTKTLGAPGSTGASDASDMSVAKETDFALSHEIRSAIIEELSVPTLCRATPDGVLGAAAPVRASLIDWTSRNVEVERETEGSGDIVVTDRTWHDDALGHVLNRRHTVQLRRRELRRIVIANPDAGGAEVRRAGRELGRGVCMGGGWVGGGG